MAFMENGNNCIKIFSMRIINKKSKMIVSFVLTAILLLASCPNASSTTSDSTKPKAYYTQQELASMSSIEFAKVLQAGWNLGNTFDSVYKPYRGEITGTTEINKLLKSRVHALTTKEMIQEIKSMGFSTIRIPISWHEHVDEYNNIDEEWMTRVKEVVDWAMEENLYVIINIHHDDKYTFEEAPGYYVSKDSSQQAKSKDFIRRVWEQVAEEFKNYDHHLVFELLNEPRYMNCVSGNSFRPNQSERITYNKIITDYEQTAVNAIRKTGGFNEARFLMVTPYAASPWETYGWKIPSDSAQDKLLVSIHTYSPYEFAMGTEKVTKFTENHKASLRNLVNTELQKQFISLGYGVVIGETSASDKLNPADRTEWVKCYFSLTRNAGISVIIWDNNNANAVGKKGDIKEYHGYLIRKSFDPQESQNYTSHWYDEDLVQTMIDVYDYKY